MRSRNLPYHTHIMGDMEWKEKQSELMLVVGANFAIRCAYTGKGLSSSSAQTVLGVKWRALSIPNQRVGWG